MQKKEKLYTITFRKDTEKMEYFSRIEQIGIKGGTNIETPMSLGDSLLIHIEGIKDRLELLLLHNKADRK